MELQVVEHRLGKGESLALEPGPRALYSVGDDTAQYSARARGPHGPLHALAFELVGAPAPAALLSAPLELARDEEWLIRLDRVDFPPGGVAYLHTHQGPGIRVLLHGSIRIETAGRAHGYGPLEAWFEPGPERVLAVASTTEPTGFVCCMVLPGRLRGQSSIRYVREEDAAKPKPQRYTVFIDEPLDEAFGSP